MNLLKAKRILVSVVAYAARIARNNPTLGTTFVRVIRANTNTRAEFSAIGRHGRVSKTRELVVQAYLVDNWRGQA
jgi:hypothetical protein